MYVCPQLTKIAYRELTCLYQFNVQARSLWVQTLTIARNCTRNEKGTTHICTLHLNTESNCSLTEVYESTLLLTTNFSTISTDLKLTAQDKCLLHWATTASVKHTRLTRKVTITGT